MRKPYTVYYIIYLTLLISVLSCSESIEEPAPPVVTNPFDSIPQSVLITAGRIDEASGLASSKINTGSFWVIEDSFRPNKLHLLQSDGTYQKGMVLKNLNNRDWEEVCVAKDPATNKQYVYIGDIGDNFLLFTDYYIYKIEEPTAATDTITAINTISFRYSDGKHNAEAFLVDETNGDIIIITKAADKASVYRIPAPQSTTVTNIATKLMDLPHTNITAACANNTEVLVKNYSKVWLYSRSAGGTIANAFTATPVDVGYREEQQGEAMSFGAGNNGFYTLSEKVNAPVTLNFYKRK